MRDQKGNLPLHGAADGGHDGVAKLLLARTNEPRAKNAGGQTPGDIARERGFGDLAKLLDGAPAVVQTRPSQPGQPVAAPAQPVATPAQPAKPSQPFNTMDIDDPNHPRFQKQ